MRKRNTVDKCRGEEEKYMSNESLCKGVGRRRVRKVFEVNKYKYSLTILNHVIDSFIIEMVIVIEMKLISVFFSIIC